MKKINRNKRKYLIKHSNKEFKRRLKFKKIRRRKNSYYIGVPLANKKLLIERKTEKIINQDYIHIKAPNIFSVTNNTEETLKFIGVLEKCFKNRNKVFVDLHNVEEIAHGAIVVLLSILVQFKSHNIKFNGNYPRKDEPRRTLTHSGFFKYLYKKIEDQDMYSFENEICTHAQRNVNSTLSNDIIKNSSKFIWGEEIRCPGLQRVFLELMQNTNNHASLDAKGKKHWWASVNKIEDDKKVCFSFIDFGVGIFESLSNKNNNNKFYNAINIMKKAFNYQTNSELLKLLLNGDVHKTVTGHYYRGKGLPGIYDAYCKNKISNLIIISNDAFADCMNHNYSNLSNKLSGTFVYWELNENNINVIGNNHEKN